MDGSCLTWVSNGNSSIFPTVAHTSPVLNFQLYVSCVSFPPFSSCQFLSFIVLPFFLFLIPFPLIFCSPFHYFLFLCFSLLFPCCLSFSSFVSLSCQLFTFLFYSSFCLFPFFSFIAVLLLFPFPFILFPFPFLSHVLFTLLSSFFISYKSLFFSLFLISCLFSYLFPSFLICFLCLPFFLFFLFSLSCVMFTLLTPSLSHVNPFPFYHSLLSTSLLSFPFICFPFLIFDLT